MVSDMKYSISGTTRLTGLLGSPVGSSRSPEIQNYAFQKLGLDYVYLALDVGCEDVNEAINAMRMFNTRGFNITMPLKEVVIRYLDSITEEAEAIGSVNTVVNENGKLVGHNTDGKGFVKALKLDGLELKGQKVVLIGAGGASKSIAIALALEDVSEIVIANRSISKAEDIVHRINGIAPRCQSKAIDLDENLIKSEVENAILMVDCTPVGTHDTVGRSIIEGPEVFHSNLHVANLIYSPLKTTFLEMAENAGCKISNGLGMLLYQGEIAFKLWTGEDMPIEDLKRQLFEDE